MKTIFLAMLLLGGMYNCVEAQLISHWINPNGEATGTFGESVDLNSSYAIVGDPKASGTSNASGAAFIYDLKHLDSKPVMALKPSGVTQDDHFGSAVAITDTFAFIGAERADYADSTDLGKVFIYKYQNGKWNYNSELSVPDTLSSGMRFGAALAADKNHLLVGAPGTANYDGVQQIGMAFMYTLHNGKWVYTENLYRSLPVEREHYGYTVDVSDSISVIGMLGYGISPKPDEAHVFTKYTSQEYWRHSKALSEKNSYWNDNYGIDVAAYGDKVFVGADEDEFEGDSKSTYGLVYVYKDINGSWIKQDTLGPSDGQSFEKFGLAMAVDSNTAIIGAPDKNSNGAVYVFNYAYGHWKQTDYITHPDPPTDPNAYSSFGSVLAMNDNFLLVSDPTHANVNGTVAGTVYLYNSKSLITSVEKNIVKQPRRMQLMPAYPNPFNPSTTIRYKLNNSSTIQIDVYNNLGQKVATLVNQKQSAGNHQLTWKPQNLSSGIYFIKVRTHNQIMVQPVTYYK
jgi:hypothetical protein